MVDKVLFGLQQRSRIILASPFTFFMETEVRIYISIWLHFSSYFGCAFLAGKGVRGFFLELL